MKPSNVASLALWALPFITVLVVAFAVFVVGAPRPYLGARVFGGPTVGVKRLALRVAAVERFAETEQPARAGELLVEASTHGGRASYRGAVDDEGAAQVVLELRVPAQAGIRLVVRWLADGRDRLLADGTFALSATDWARTARRRGGWLRGQQSGALAVRVAPARGAFAVPFSDPLLIEVRSAAGPTPRARLSFSPEGLQIGDARERELRTDALGFARLRLAPLDHAVALDIEAHSTEGATGTLYTMLPVVPGALHATLDGGGLRIASAVVRDRAYFSLVTQSARLGGGTAHLVPDARGGAAAIVDVHRLLEGTDGDVWAVVSSEPDLRTRSAVGWPVRVGEQPARTFDVPDSLLLDGMRRGFDEDMARRQRARLLAGVFTLFALLLIVTLMRYRVRAAEHQLSEHLREAGASPEEVEGTQPPRTGVALLVAALCLALGFVVILLVALLRIG
jgi:hypothetical protein